MKVKRTIPDFYNYHQDGFLKNLSAAKKLRVKDVHKLRVEIKNLRVLFDFLLQLRDKKLNCAAFIKFLRPVFKKSGKLRTQQINLTLTRSYRSLLMKRFKEHLLNEEISAGKSLVKEIKNFDKKKFRRLHQDNLNTLRRLDLKTINKEWESQARGVFVKLRKNIFEVDDDESLHRVRKCLKTLRKMRQVLLEIAPATALTEGIKKLDDLYDAVGKWHDGIVFVNAFENYVLKNERTASQTYATKLLLQLIDKNEYAKMLILKRLKVEVS